MNIELDCIINIVNSLCLVIHYNLWCVNLKYLSVIFLNLKHNNNGVNNITKVCLK